MEMKIYFGKESDRWAMLGKSRNAVASERRDPVSLPLLSPYTLVILL